MDSSIHINRMNLFVILGVSGIIILLNLPIFVESGVNCMQNPDQKLRSAASDPDLYSLQIFYINDNFKGVWYDHFHSF